MGCAPHPQFRYLYKIGTNGLIVVGFVYFLILVLQSSSLPYRSLRFSLLSFKFVNESYSTGSSVILGVVSSTEGIDVGKEKKGEGGTNRKDKELNNDFQEKTPDFKEAELRDPISSLRNSTEPRAVLLVKELHESDNEDNTLGYISSLEQFVSSPMALKTKIDVSTNLETSSMGKEATKTFWKAASPSRISDMAMKGKWMPPPTSISEMNRLLHQSRVSSGAMRPRWPSIHDQELLYAKSQIKGAPVLRSERGLYAPLYRNVSMFKRSYELMEKMLKVYIYNEGEKPIFHQPKLKGIYASEGWFMKLMEENKQFVVKDPTKAHIFYLPFSAYMLRSTLYINSQHHKSLNEFLKKYVNLIAGKYDFWNRTVGADHFLVACHDWALRETNKYMDTCIRALCNAKVSRGFKIGKDVSLPVTMIRFEDDPLRSLGAKPPSKRPFLAFFAGHMHGYLRPILLEYWENKDPDMKIFGPLPRNGTLTYREYMKSSRYCICARGYEVHTPRVVEAIFHECVPVIISDNYVPPFFEVLNWEAFAVFIPEKDVANLKRILLSIPKKRYLELHMRVKKVQKHFLWHKNPVKHDIFHMTLHSIWYNRVFQINLS